MATLEQIFQSLKAQADSGQGRKAPNGVIYVDRILRLPQLKRLTLKVNYASDGHFSLVVFKGNNIKRQFPIFPEDVEDLAVIVNFLQRYGDVISKYVRYSAPASRSNRYVELDDFGGNGNGNYVNNNMGYNAGYGANGNMNPNMNANMSNGNGNNMNNQQQTRRPQAQQFNIMDEF